MSKTWNFPKQFVWAVVCFLGFFLIQISTPALIKVFYEYQAFDFLNWITFQEQVRTFDFYLGRITDLWMGPFAFALGGLSFVIFGLICMENAKFHFFAFCVFAFLILTKFSILFSPPYGDTINGPFAEALWLFENKMNYLELSQQPAFVQGGPKVYLFSIFPGFQALIMLLVRSQKLFFLTYHLIAFGMGAYAVALFRAVCRKLFDRKTALILSFIFLLYPLFNAQIESFNMEPPLMLFGLASVFFLINRRFFLAAVMANLAAATKGTGLFVCLTVFVVCVFVFFFDHERKFNGRVLASGFFSLAFMLLEFYASMFLLYHHEKAFGGFLVQPFIGRHPMKYSLATYAAIFFGVAWLFDYLRYGLFRTREWFRDEGKYATFVMVVFTAMWFVLHLNCRQIIPRYLFVLLPGLIFGVAYAIKTWNPYLRLNRWILFCVIAVCFAGSYGFGQSNYTPGEPWVRRTDLSYRTGVKVHQKMGRVIDEQYGEYAIVAPFTIAQMIAIQNMGYVQKPHDVYVYMHPCQYGGIKPYPGLNNLPKDKTVFIGFPVVQFYGPHDVILHRLEFGDRDAVIFRGGILVELVYRQALKTQEKRRKH